MNTTIVVTLIGEERQGVIAQISELVAKHEGDWLKSEFHSFGGRFAGILQLAVASSQASRLKQALNALEGQQLQLLISEAGVVESEYRYPLTLHCVGLDRRSIVSDISAILGRNGVAILSLNSRCTPAPMSSEQLFEAEFRLELPASLSSEHICAVLETLTPELMIDIEADLNPLPLPLTDNRINASRLISA